MPRSSSHTAPLATASGLPDLPALALDAEIAAVPSGPDGPAAGDMRGALAARPARRWRLPLLFGCILLVALGLRLYRLGDQPLFLDEAFSEHVVTAGWSDFWAIIESDLHPPLYYLALRGALELLPNTPWGLRLPSVLCSLAGLVLATAFAWRWWGARSALTGALLLGISPFYLYHAQDARMYTLLALCWLLAGGATVELLVRERASRPAARWWLLWALGLASAPYIHYYGLLLLASAPLVVLCAGLLWRLPARFWRYFGLNLTLVALAVLPLLPLFLKHNRLEAGGAWQPSWGDLPTLVDLSLLGFTSAEDRLIDGFHLRTPGPFIADWLWHVLGAVLVVAPITAALLRARAQGQRPVAQATIVLALTLLPVALSFGYFMLADRPAWSYKGLIGSGLLLILLASWSFAALPRRLGQLLLISICLLNLLSLSSYYGRWLKSDVVPSWQAFVAQARPGDVYVLRWNYEMLPLSYYDPAPAFPIATQYDLSNAETLTTVAGKTGAFQKTLCQIAPSFGRIFAISPSLLPAMRQDQRQLPCLADSELWVYDPALRRWQPYEF